MEEKFKEMIKEGVKEVLIELGVNNIKIDGKDPDELLDIDQVCEEFNIGKCKARKIFKDPNLPVQTYTKKHKIARGEMQKYIKVRHDNLSDRR